MKIAVVPDHLLQDVVLLGDLLRFLLEAVVDSLQEEQSEDVVLIVSRVDAHERGGALRMSGRSQRKRCLRRRRSEVGGLFGLPITTEESIPVTLR